MASVGRRCVDRPAILAAANNDSLHSNPKRQRGNDLTPSLALRVSVICKRVQNQAWTHRWGPILFESVPATLLAKANCMGTLLLGPLTLVLAVAPLDFQALQVLVEEAAHQVFDPQFLIE